MIYAHWVYFIVKTCMSSTEMHPFWLLLENKGEKGLLTQIELLQEKIMKK